MSLMIFRRVRKRISIVGLRFTLWISQSLIVRDADNETLLAFEQLRFYRRDHA